MKKIIFLAAIISIFSACKKLFGMKTDEQETITQVSLRFTDSLTNKQTTFNFSDADGPGGNPATIDTIVLDSNRVYKLDISVFDQTKSPVEDVSAEILEKGDEHQFFFESPLSSLKIDYEDSDKNGMPIGLKTRWQTGSSVTGSVKITLKHQPGQKTNPGSIGAGETDVEVTFPMR